MLSPILPADLVFQADSTSPFPLASPLALSGSGPYELVGQTLWEAKNQGVAYSAENALPRYDDTAYSTIVNNAVRLNRISAFTYLRLTDDLV